MFFFLCSSGVLVLYFSVFYFYSLQGILSRIFLASIFLSSIFSFFFSSGDFILCCFFLLKLLCSSCLSSYRGFFFLHLFISSFYRIFPKLLFFFYFFFIFALAWLLVFRFPGILAPPPNVTNQLRTLLRIEYNSVTSGFRG